MANIQPQFDDSIFDSIVEDVKTRSSTEQPPADRIFEKLLEQIQPINFVSLAKVQSSDKLSGAHLRILSIDHILRSAEQNSWGLCRNQEFLYVFNGTHWILLDQGALRSFLGMAAEKLGVHWEKARDFAFRKALFEQFLESGNFISPKRGSGVLIPLQNGTFVIANGMRTIRPHDRNDFLTYQLPFEYNPEAIAPRFQTYLNEVLPEDNRQEVLAEFLGYLFLPDLKLEKALILYGSGANGKSVIFEIITALLGSHNISNYSLQSLTDRSGYYRAQLANKLLNYASEINGSLEASVFKQLASGEPLEARLPYGNPMIISKYARLIFNANVLPHDVEHSHAFFRRFLIIPFDVTIPEERQDKELSMKIIESELPGVFNWILSGLDRLLRNKRFTECDAVKKQLESFRLQSDSVAMFLDENEYRPAVNDRTALKDMFSEFKTYCNDSGYRTCSIRTFADRLRALKFATEKSMRGVQVFAVKPRL